jgi:hypothetical protein
MQTALTVLAIVAAVLAAGVFGAFALAIWRARALDVHESEPPKALDYDERLAAIERRVGELFTIRAEWSAYQDIIDDALETTEVKRRRAAASASKRGRTQPTQDELAALASGEFPGAPAATPSAIPVAEINDRAALRRRAISVGRL